MKIIIDTEKISLKRIFILLTIGILISFVWLLLTPLSQGITRTEGKALQISLSKIEKWQNILKSDKPFMIADFNDIFIERKISKPNSNLDICETNIRNFYNISNDYNISIIGELMKLKKDELEISYTKNNAYIIKPINYDYYRNFS